MVNEIIINSQITNGAYVISIETALQDDDEPVARGKIKHTPPKIVRRVRSFDK